MVRLRSALPFIGILLLFEGITVQPMAQRYHLINSSLNWYEAQSFCRLKFTDLATVNNMDDKNKLVNTLGSHVMHSWIGLQRGGTRRWMWSDGRGRAQFTMWNEGEPNDVAGSEYCAEMSETGPWNDIPCWEEKAFVCYDRLQDGKVRYVHYSTKKTFFNSQELCRSRHTDMACVSSTADNSEIANVANVWSGNKVWIGLFNDAWVWSHGEETSFRYWLSSTEYQENCASVAASQQGRWVGVNCNERATFVCQGDLKVKKRLIRMVVRSDADLTDSTVSDALLTKLTKVLRGQWLTDFNLRWRSDQNGIIFRHQKQQEVVEEEECDHADVPKTAGIKLPRTQREFLKG